MSSETRLQPPLTRDLESRSALEMLPSWGTSVIVHLLFFLLCAMGLKSCTDQMGVAPGEQFREVGIYVKSASDVPIEQEANPERLQDAAADDVAAAAELPENPVDQPPVQLKLPSATPQTIGQGTPVLPNASQNDVLDIVEQAGTRPAGAPAPGSGETSFISVRDTGSRFVYVIDCSGSMTGAPMQFAKSQLKRSLQSLNKNQQFQIIFYNRAYRVMSLKTKPRSELYRATDLNVTEAGRYIDIIRPDFGTEHKPALKEALRLRPEVVFFLTDGREPRLRPDELQEIQRLNRGSRIHCIEFAEGMELGIPGGNWLKRLASANGGTYRHIDTTTLRRR